MTLFLREDIKMSVSFTQDKNLSTICVYKPGVLGGKVIETTYTEGFHLLLGKNSPLRHVWDPGVPGFSPAGIKGIIP